MPSPIDPSGELSRILAPVHVDAFAQTYWEQLPLHVARNAPDYFSATYGISDVEDALVTGARDLDRFALVRSGAPQAPLDAYVVTRPPIRPKSAPPGGTAHVDARNVHALFERGYTLVIKDAALVSPRLQRTCSRLQHELGAFVGANVYLTPPGAQGLDAHHDSHDTLVIQIEGSKTWRIFEPVVALPLETQPLHAGTALPPLTHHCDVTLAPGDTLYLPRGYVHTAAASGERALHVTFALAPVRAIDLLHATLDLRAEADAALRRALPLGWIDDPGFAAAFAATLAPHVPAIFSAAAIDAGTQAALHEQFAASRTDAAGLFERTAQTADLSAESVLSIAAGAAYVLRERGTTLELLVAGKALGLPPVCKAAFERIEAGPVRFGDLAIPLPDADRELFVKALVREGVVLVGRPN